MNILQLRTLENEKKIKVLYLLERGDNFKLPTEPFATTQLTYTVSKEIELFYFDRDTNKVNSIIPSQILQSSIPLVILSKKTVDLSDVYEELYSISGHASDRFTRFLQSVFIDISTIDDKEWIISGGSSYISSIKQTELRAFYDFILSNKVQTSLKDIQAEVSKSARSLENLTTFVGYLRLFNKAGLLDSRNSDGSSVLDVEGDVLIFTKKMIGYCKHPFALTQIPGDSREVKVPKFSLIHRASFLFNNNILFNFDDIIDFYLSYGSISYNSSSNYHDKWFYCVKEISYSTYISFDTISLRNPNDETDNMKTCRTYRYFKPLLFKGKKGFYTDSFKFFSLDLLYYDDETIFSDMFIIIYISAKSLHSLGMFSNVSSTIELIDRFSSPIQSIPKDSDILVIMADNNKIYEAVYCNGTKVLLSQKDMFNTKCIWTKFLIHHNGNYFNTIWYPEEISQSINSVFFKVESTISLKTRDRILSAAYSPAFILFDMLEDSEGSLFTKDILNVLDITFEELLFMSKCFDFFKISKDNTEVEVWVV
jgi:hypothetical protein